MCKKLIYLVSFVLVLGLISDASAELVAHWTFNEGSGNIAYDSSGNGNNGTINGAEWGDGKYGKALQFNGQDNYVEMPTSSSLEMDANVTIAAWINWIDAGDGWLAIMANGQQDGPWENYGLFINRGGRYLYFTLSLDGVAVTQQTPNNVIEPDEWLHACATWDGSTARIYVNGEMVLEQAQTGELVPSQLPLRIGHRNLSAHYYNGIIDDVRIYNHALSADEVSESMLELIRELASAPFPDDGATDVPRDVVLSWGPGIYADKHDVYFGTDFDDVNDADRTTPLDVLVSQNQVPDSYSPAELLQFGQTYYWRIDEVNAPPSSTIFKGDVWSFTAEPIAYPIAGERITVTASSNGIDQGPENTVNGSGLDANDLHSVELADMWLSNIAGQQPTWIQYEFDKVCKLHQMWVWNHNTLTEPVIGFGVKDGTIEYSLDGVNWTTLGTTHEFARGSGAAGYAYNTTVDFGGVAVKYVRLTAKSNWGGLLPQYGLSEVCFLYIPVWAREPNPASEATDVDVDLVLSFRAGREAAEHNVYLSTDEQAVIDESISPVSVPAGSSYASYDTGTLDLVQSYYWKINEVNDAETTTTWQGDIWNFTTLEYLVVDDFELYNDIPDGEEGSNLVYLTWIDGYENPSVNGSTMGHTVAFEPSMESVTVYDGMQSAPLYYDNSTAGYSEATANVADLQVGQDWTKHGIKALTLRFSGDPNNAVQQMYVKVNGSKVTYDGDAENLKLIGWQMWYIDLSSLGVSLSNVTELSIGFERSGAVGGQGVVYFDGIRLYSHDRQFITPVEPGTANLVGHWQFDEGSGTTAADSSGNNNHGTITGAEWVAGQVGGALNFNGAEYVEVPPAAWSSIEKQATVAFWAYGDPSSQPQANFIFGAYQDLAVNNSRVASSHCPWSDGTVYFDTGGTADGFDRISKAATPVEYEGSWQHWTFTKDADTGEQSIYLNGFLWQSGTGLTRPMTGVTAFTIGCKPDITGYYVGMMDDFRLYDRALSEGEVAWLGGRTMSFDKPF